MNDNNDVPDDHVPRILTDADLRRLKPDVWATISGIIGERLTDFRREDSMKPEQLGYYYFTVDQMDLCDELTIQEECELKTGVRWNMTTMPNDESTVQVNMTQYNGDLD